MLQLALSILLVQVTILALLRPVILWYFQVDRRTKALESIARSLRYLPGVRAEDTRSRRAG